MSRNCISSWKLAMAFPAIAGVVAILIPSSGEACRCLPKPPPREALDKAVAVFLGQARSVKGSIRRTYAFGVRRYWKGDVGRNAEVTTAASSAACGVSFRIGESYLVYASKAATGRGFATSICTRTRPESAAQEDLRVLGKGKTPTGAPDRSVAGRWTAKRKWVVELQFDAQGTFEKSDLVSPCPPNARCIWSGVVVNRGTYEVHGADLRLSYKSTDGKMGVTTPRALRIERGALVERLPDGTFLKYQRSDSTGTGGGAACGRTVCPAGQVCCNASCGICTPPGGACIQMACSPATPSIQ